MKTYPLSSAYLGLLLVFTISQALSLLEPFQLDPKKVEELQNEVILRVVTPEDGELHREIKIILVKYLVETTLNDYIKKVRGNRQDDGDGEDAVAAAQDPDQVINGVRRLLQNVFAGNLIGVIQEGVGIRAPGRVQDFFSDVMGALFGSNAVKGFGTHGVANITTETPLNATQLPPGAIAQQQYNPSLVGGVNPQQVPVAQQPIAGSFNSVPAYPNAQQGVVPVKNYVNNGVATNRITPSQQVDEDDENDDFY